MNLQAALMVNNFLAKWSLDFLKGLYTMKPVHGTHVSPKGSTSHSFPILPNLP
jgi:hypothetical protein